MRLIALLAVAILSPFAVSQQKPTSTEYDRKVQEAFEFLGRWRAIKFRIEATEGRGGIPEHTYRADAYFTISPEYGRDVFRLEVREYADRFNPQPLRRIVADGSRFYVYDPIQKIFGVESYNTRRPLKTLVRLMDSVADDGPLTMLSKLFDQVYGSGFPVFENWLPGSYPVADGPNVVYSRGTAPQPHSSVGFLMFPLRAIVFTERSGHVIAPQVSNWTLWIENAPLLARIGGADFTFVPPQNARKVDLRTFR